MQKHSFDAVIFDLDGVITQTALTHADAWKDMFDQYLKDRAERFGEPFREFTHAGDYLPYVDGKPRYKGVESFLKSRNIDIPFGSPDDSTDMETCCGLGNRKNEAFNEILERDGAKVYESSVRLIKELKEAGIKLGVASSSKNCKPVLESVDLLHYFETRVDGVVSAELDLQGKPEPDIFTTAADNLGVTYDRSVVVEDAVSGVQAGRKGNFGFVIGVARENNIAELRNNGADIVFEDLEELNGIKGIEEWFTKGLPEELWTLGYPDYDPVKERSRESLLTTGNGYMGTRGAIEELDANPVNYPGTYMAGLYNTLESKVEDRKVSNEDFVNIPNWLLMTFRIDDDNWFNPNKTEILDIHRTLDFRNGLLTRKLTVEDEEGRKTLIESRRTVSMHDKHLAALEYIITPLNYSAIVSVRSGLNANLINDGVKRYKQLNQSHLQQAGHGADGAFSWVTARTVTSETEISVSARLNVNYNNQQINPNYRHTEVKGRVDTSFKQKMAPGDSLKIEKLVCICNSLDGKTDDTRAYVLENGMKIPSFDNLLEGSATEWDSIWKRADIRIEGDRLAQKLLRMHIYHLMVTTSPHNEDIDFGIPARGLHGEAYRGHIFWDELYILAFYCLHFPAVARSVLMYRYRRLDAAREYAREYGYKGAMFPWQSGSRGTEETQTVHLNPVSGEWGEDYSSLQRHISIAVAYNVWTYYNITGDTDFIEESGAEMFLEICRFWASKTVFNEESGRFEIHKVMGPDEFHEKLPGSESGGLKDNAYTNIMVVWLFNRAFDLMNAMEETSRDKVLDKINLNEEELKVWREEVQKMNLIISEEGIIAQFDGYFELDELDWDHYKKKYDKIYRMDRLLKAEGKSPDSYKLSKQADTLMCFYNIGRETVTDIVRNLGYKLPEGYLEKNFDYYYHRCSHGSTLSRVVHASIAAQIGRNELSWTLYNEALQSDFSDIQGGTTAEGIHAGVMGGTVLMAMMAFAGLNIQDKVIHIDPAMPDHWRSVSFRFNYRGNEYNLKTDSSGVYLTSSSSSDGTVFVRGKEYKLRAGEELAVLN
ncbi:MAG: beta-phosphoglucomutase family hydrolase [Bacteroidales bacterium]